MLAAEIKNAQTLTTQPINSPSLLFSQMKSGLSSQSIIWTRRHSDCRAGLGSLRREGPPAWLSRLWHCYPVAPSTTGPTAP